MHSGVVTDFSRVLVFLQLLCVQFGWLVTSQNVTEDIHFSLFPPHEVRE